MRFLSILSFLLIFQPGLRYQPNPVPKSRHKFVVIAHRGDHTIYPENTLQAYGQAIKYGADYVEIDLRTTKDGQLISLHDADVHRMTGGTGQVKELTLTQIESLKLNANNKADTSTYRIPTLEQILNLCKDKIYIYIDFKDADAAQTLKLLQQYQIDKQVLVYINKPAQLTDWRKTASKMPLMLSMPDSVKNTMMMRKFLDQYRPDLLDGNYEQYDRQMLEFAKYYDLPVWPDGQSILEGPLVWEKVIGIGLKGLQTDNLPSFVKYLIQKGLR